MSTPTTTAWTPRTQRRNRIALGVMVLSMVPLAGIASWLSPSPKSSGPLLLAIDELPVRSPFAACDEPPLTTLGDGEARFLMATVFAPLICEVMEANFNRAETTDADVHWFNGRPVKPVRTIVMITTGYSPDERSCGESADGVTASGYSVWTNGMNLVAADTTLLPFGTMVSVPGYNDGHVVPVLDRGGAIKGFRLDLLHPTHEQAMQWGTQKLEVTVWEYADGLPSNFVARFNSASAVKD